MDSLVSVIMSAYNAEESLGSSIESILNQTYENLEILIMDDGSSDSTHQICQHYEKEHSKIKTYKNGINPSTLNINSSEVGGEPNREIVSFPSSSRARLVCLARPGRLRNIRDFPFPFLSHRAFPFTLTLSFPIQLALSVYVVFFCMSVC